jgi:hypothetical protein
MSIGLPYRLITVCLLWLSGALLLDIVVFGEIGPAGLAAGVVGGAMACRHMMARTPVQHPAS